MPYKLVDGVEVHIVIVNIFSELFILNNKASCKPKYVNHYALYKFDSLNFYYFCIFYDTKQWARPVSRRKTALAPATGRNSESFCSAQTALEGTWGLGSGVKLELVPASHARSGTGVAQG